MATLEDRLKDKEYKFWIKGGVCLGFVKQGLETFSDSRSKKLISYVKSVLPKTSAALHSVCLSARVHYDKTKKTWALGCCVECEAYIGVLLYLANPPFKPKRGNWKNTLPQLWPSDPWNMAKVYMNEGQKSSQRRSKDADLCAIVNFLENCSLPKVDIQKAQNLSKVRQARNSIFHSASMKLTKDEFETATDAMIDLLEDPLFLCREKDAQEAVIAIKKIQKTEFEISAINEFQVITEKLEAMKSQHDVLRDEVDILKADLNEEKDKLSNVLEHHEGFQKAVEDLQMELCKKESQIKEVFIDLAFVKKKVHEDLQLSERIDVRVKAVEDSLQRTDIEVRNIGLEVKAVKHQMAESSYGH